MDIGVVEIVLWNVQKWDIINIICLAKNCEQDLQIIRKYR